MKTSINPFDPSNAAKPDLSTLSLEDLMGIEVTSAAKQKQRLSDVAAAISVITQEDISRSGYQTIGELLRLAPGVYVGQIDPLRFAVGVRGGANILSNNLLVMMDGRSVYSPADAGVFYEAMDYIMQDIERIEVVRGPGATLWGANAVNGVINVVTKSAKDTQGFLFDSHAGTDGYVNSFRYGGHVGDGMYFRIYGINRAMNDFDQASGKTANDGMDQNRAGFRMDAALSGQDALTVTGEMFQQRAGATFVKPIPIPTLPYTRLAQGDFNSYGSNLMARWTHTFSETSDFTVQGYFWNLTDISGNLIHNLKDIQSSYDIDFQHRFALMGNQEIIWGGDYRFSTVEFGNIPHAFTAPDRTNTEIGSIFVQDDLTLIPERVHVIAGTKVEYDSIVNSTEVQPSIRGIWTPDAKNTLWASVSRAARIPSPTELYCSPTEVRIPLPNHQPFDQDRIANPDLQVQHLIAYEAGYRAEPIKSLSLDISTFYYASDHQYERVTLPNEIIDGQVVRPVRKTDDQNGQAWGFEIAPTWHVADNLSLSGSYSYLNMVQFGGISQLPYVQPDPRNQFKLQIHYDVCKQIGADSEFYWIDEFKSLKVPAYFRWDASVKWRPEKHVELSAGVWNIIDNGHPEQPSTVGTAYQVPRTFFVQLQVNF